MIPLLNKNHLLGTCIFSKSGQIKEGGLSELFYSDVTEPDKELLRRLVKDAREALIGLGPIETDLRVKFEDLSLTLINLEEFDKYIAVVY